MGIITGETSARVDEATRMADQSQSHKDNLFGLLKNLWSPIAEFLGAVTTAYTFYQLWQGDQASLNYFLAGGVLLVVLIALAWVGFKTKTVHRGVLLLGEEMSIEHRPAYPAFYRRARIGLALVLLGMIAGGGILLQRRQALQAKLVVVVAAFDGPEQVYGLQNEIIEKLDADFSGDDSVEIKNVPDVITPEAGSPAARKLGQRYLADVVLWGWYRPTQNPNITLHVENLDPPGSLPLDTSSTLKPSANLADLQSFSFQQQAGQETGALIFFLTGYIQYKNNHYTQALAHFDDALDQISGNAQLLNNQDQIYLYRGNTYLSLDQYTQALADYTQAIHINPKNVNAYVNRGATYGGQRQTDKALADYTQAIQLDPKDVLAYYNRGTTYGDQGQYDKALADFDQAIQLDPKDAAAYNNRGFAYDKQGQTDKALADFNKAIQLDPKDANAYFNRGNAYDKQQQYDKALADYTQAIQLDPKLALAYNNRGLVYQKLGKTAEAAADFAQYQALSGQTQSSGAK